MMIYDSALELETEELELTAEPKEFWSLDEECLDREAQLAAAVGDISGVTARPVQGYRQEQTDLSLRFFQS